MGSLRGALSPTRSGTRSSKRSTHRRGQPHSFITARHSWGSSSGLHRILPVRRTFPRAISLHQEPWRIPTRTVELVRPSSLLNSVPRPDSRPSRATMVLARTINVLDHFPASVGSTSLWSSSPLLLPCCWSRDSWCGGLSFAPSFFSFKWYFGFLYRYWLLAITVGVQSHHLAPMSRSPSPWGGRRVPFFFVPRCVLTTNRGGGLSCALGQSRPPPTPLGHGFYHQLAHGTF